MVQKVWFIWFGLYRFHYPANAGKDESLEISLTSGRSRKLSFFYQFTLTFKECPSLWNSWCLGSSSRDFLIPRVPKTLNLVTFTGRLNIRYVTYHMSHMIAIIPGESSKNQLWRNVIVIMDWNGSSVTMERQINILILVISILAFH